MQLVSFPQEHLYKAGRFTLAINQFFSSIGGVFGVQGDISAWTLNVAALFKVTDHSEDHNRGRDPWAYFGHGTKIEATLSCLKSFVLKLCVCVLWVYVCKGSAH